MPVSYNSAARNLFLLGSSGQQVAQNFFKYIDKENSVGDGYISTEQIKYFYDDDKYVIAGSGRDLNLVGYGFFDKRNYDQETDPENPTTTLDYETRIVSTNPNPSTGFVELFGMHVDSNGDLIVCGHVDGTSPWIAKYNYATGVLDWQSSTFTGNIQYTSVTSDVTGYYACGSSTVTGETVVEKYDLNGNPVWGKKISTVGGSSNKVTLRSISANSRGQVVAVGNIVDLDQTKGYMVKITTDGDYVWDKSLQADQEEGGWTYKTRLTDIHVDDKDQLFVSGNLQVTSGGARNGDRHGWIGKFTAEGNLIWQKQTVNGSGTHMNHRRVSVDNQTEQVIVVSEWSSLSDEGISLSKYSKSGKLLWRRSLISDSSSFIDNPVLDADSSFYYISFIDENYVTLSNTPYGYVFGKVSTSGNGLGNFDYPDGSGSSHNYAILNITDEIGRLDDGSVRFDSSDLRKTPFSANHIMFDDYSTQVSKKKINAFDAGVMQYSGSPAIRPADFQELNLLGDVYSGSGDWLDQSRKGNDATTSFTTVVIEPFAGAGSVEFDGSGDYLSLASSSDFALGTGDWTVEWFAYPTSDTQYQRHFYLQGSSATTIDGVFANPSGIAFGRTNVWATPETSHPLNQWNHYALVHDSTNMRLYLNGVEVLTTSDNFGTDTTKSLNIGHSNSTYGGYFTGNISNFKILKGTALYTAAFTPPTSALTNTGQTTTSATNYSTIYSSMLTSPGLKTATAGFTAPHSNTGTNPIRSEGTGGLLFTPTTPISYSSQVEVLDNNNVTATWFNQTNSSGSSTQHANGWVTVASGSGTINTIYTQRTDNAGWDAGFCAIRVDGTILEDSVWSPDDAIASNKPPSQLFDGNLSTRVETVNAGTSVRWTPTTTTTWSSSLRINTGAYSGSITVRANGTTTVIHANGTQVQSPYWTSHPNSSGTIEYIEAQGHIGAGTGYMTAIEIDGTVLVNSSGGGTTGTTLLTAQGSSITDASDSNNTITVNGDAAAVVGITNGPTHNADGYWEFDGTDDTIEIGDLGVDMSQMTVEIWFKSDTLTNWQNPIDCNFSVPDPADDVVKSGNIGPRLEINASGGCRWYWGASLSDNNRNFPSTSTGIAAGQWYHSVLSIDGPLGSDGSDYLNGEFLGTGGQNGTAGNTWFGECKDVKLGRGFVLSNRHFDGKIGAVRIYPRALTAAQVYQNYNATKSKYINEAPDTAPKIGPGIVTNSNLLLNYDFGNRATYDDTQNYLVDNFASDTDTGEYFTDQYGKHKIYEANTNLNSIYGGSPFFSTSSSDTFDVSVSMWMKALDTQTNRFALLNGSGAPVTNTYSFVPKNDNPDGGIISYTWTNVTISGNWNFVLSNSNGNARTMQYAKPQLTLKSSVGRYVKANTGVIAPPTTVKNLSSSSYPGTINGATSNSDGYFEFVGPPGLGAGDYINIGTTSTFKWIHDRTESDWAIEGWYWNNRDEEYGAMISNNSGTSTVGFYMGQRNDEQFECVINKGTQGTQACRVLSTNGLDHDTWYHIAFVNDNYTIKLYVNGVLQSNGGDQNSFSTSSTANAQTDLRIAKLGDSPAWNLDGKIGAIRIYQTSLSADEVSQNFNATKSKYGL